MNEKITELMKENSNLIYNLSHKFINYQDKEDLYQTSVFGIEAAYNNFDETKGVKFSTYAYRYIKGEMSKYVRKDKSLKISRSYFTLNLKISKAIMKLSQKLMRIPTNKEIAHYLEIPEYKINEVKNIYNLVQSLDEPVKGEENDLSLYEVIPNIEHIDLNTLIALKEELVKLKETELLIIVGRYFEGLTQTEIANKIGVNQVQVSRMEKKILQKLKMGLN